MTSPDAAHNVFVCCAQTSSDGPASVDQKTCPVGVGQPSTLEAARAYVLPSPVAQVPFSIDYAQTGAFWTLAFTTVVGLWFVSTHVGALLGFVRRG